LVVPGTALAVIHRELIIELAARHQLPAIYSDRVSVTITWEIAAVHESLHGTNRSVRRSAAMRLLSE
jgi:hypothetical protein